jgi:hypothetical protein
MTTRQKLLAGGGALLAAALIGAGIGLLVSGSDNNTEVATSGTTTSTSTSTTLAAATTTTGGTPVTVGIICTTAEDATKSVVAAWMAGDKAAAERCASSTAADKLFETNGAGAQWTFQGCSGDPGVPTCSYSYVGGGANFKLNGTEAGGWKVVEVSFVAD